MALITRSNEVVSRFCRAPGALREFRKWQNQRPPEVVDYVLSHDTRVLYGLTLDNLVRVLPSRRRPDDHALGNVNGDQAKVVGSIKNWNPDFAFTHVFHYALETMGTFPAWSALRRFFQEDATANAMLWEPSLAMIAKAAKEGWGMQRAQDAMQWRIGNFYYSFLREVYAVVRLRTEGLEVCAHPLADALFRVDGWCENKVISIYVRNPEFRDGQAGRKPDVEVLLKDADPPFTFVPVVLPPASRFAEAHLPDIVGLRAVVAALRGAEAPGMA
ncbi:hypothetical protein [Nonomuraea endophytica]|uniref:hypothetical protein n=1 Tax=Nonomuraea endophytica TaxID=714136 RepID=UPI0037C938D3